jgi:hypothetical protein
MALFPKGNGILTVVVKRFVIATMTFGNHLIYQLGKLFSKDGDVLFSADGDMLEPKE